jgi:primosomal protein N'
MTYVNIVPARRMPVDRPWLTYICPETLHVEPGMLVTIPLRGQDVVGVVWETTTEVDPKKTYRELKSIITPHPLFTDWSRQILAAAADTHSTTLSWLVHRIVPDLRPQRLKKLFSTIVEAPKVNHESPESTQLWYQERRSGIQSILQYAKSHTQRQIVVLTPTADDALQLVEDLESTGRSAIYVHSQLSATVMAELIVRLNHGEPLCIVGGVYALCLPYPTEPESSIIVSSLFSAASRTLKVCAWRTSRDPVEVCVGASSLARALSGDLVSRFVAKNSAISSSVSSPGQRPTMAATPPGAAS